MISLNCSREKEYEKLERRKLREIEHSDRRRAIVKGYEYFTDASEIDVFAKYIDGTWAYEKHFANMKFYSIARQSFAYRDRALFKIISGKNVLDYCCGNGEIALEMAKHGAKKVFGIDISKVAVNNAKELAKNFGVEDQCEFHVMDAEATDFEDCTFDVVHEYGALHHLELESAFRELSRILKHNGNVICTEALRHNPFINLYRKKTPHLRTKWEVEHILGVPEIMSGLKYFQYVNVRFFHLAALGAVPFRRMEIFKKLLRILERVDNIILRVPGFQRMAWVAVIIFSGPIKK